MDESSFSLLKKSFPFLISAATGVSWKMLDDFQDKFKLSNDSLSVEFSKVATIFFTTLYILQDVWIGIIFCIVVFSCLFVNSIDNNFWKSASFIPFFLTFYTLFFQTFEITGNILIHAFFIILMFFTIILEGKLFPEEESTSKTISRFFLITILSGLFYFLYSFPEYKWFQNFCIFMIFYFSTSILNTFILKKKMQETSFSEIITAVEVK